MHCFCYAVYNKKGGIDGMNDLRAIDFTDVEKGAKNLCIDWATNYAA